MFGSAGVAEFVEVRAFDSGQNAQPCIWRLNDPRSQYHGALFQAGLVQGSIYPFCPLGGQWNGFSGRCESTRCPSGTWALDPGGATCSRPDQPIPGSSPDANPRSCPVSSNPIAIGSGNRLIDGSDLSVGAGSGAFGFTRFYNSQIIRSAGPVLSSRWTHTYSRWIELVGATAGMFRPDGAMRTATLVNTTITSGRQRWTVAGSTLEQLWRTFDASNQPTGWLLVDPAGKTVESYNSLGRLTTITQSDGNVHTMAYSDGSSGAGGGVVLDAAGNPTATPLPIGLLIRITSTTKGTSLQLGYDGSSRVVRLTDAQGQTIRYAYDSAGNLATVTYPTTPVTTRQYLYNETALTSGTTLPAALTGIIDETGRRTASYSYDSQGRAVGTQNWADASQSTAVNTATLSFSTPGTTVVTDALGSQRSYAFTAIDGRVLLTGQSQPGGAGCGPASSSITYDAQANVTSRTDFTNRKTCYANDLTRNFETARVEGLTAPAACPTDVTTYVPTAGTEQRKQLTQWHPDWRLETRRAEPKKLTTWVYNGQPDPTAGNAITTCAPTDALVDGKPIAVVCKQVEQATSDDTGGAGFGAAAVGTAKVQRWTYNRWGQVLTANGPRTDNPGGRDDLTTYEYYADTQTDWTMGDLKQITNALGHVTRFTKYDRNGRLLQQIDANGAVTDTAYTPRGWLKEVKLTPAGSATSQRTVYEYDAVGQMTKATLPDGTSTTYTYDAARRLTGVTDSAGNRVSYTLDAMGNRTKEEWKDPGGTLRKTITRTIDALNRVQQVVGAVQ
jgi:YD repeat-containing protein